ncbi:beta-ketoacyl-ACP synthase [Tianweitania sediminis]|uniref:Beta-ketoacyl-ACP synthase n=1 Tax=Tianweitania sediminis TaxID=1502156 RepID=A0A8J7R398_9HYPH|nr:beta-ketoacyl-ACP synthase [Tianweitania sediminis]MBP0439696.1 beta-ketoacyl-ACP synthase [Tianweitania sediminis]
MSANDVVITGIGLVSSLGEGTSEHWNRISDASPAPVIDGERFAPYTVHPLPEIDWGKQIAKRGDQRQMETWQRLGTYAAGLALDDAGIKNDEALCATMDMVVAAGGGERDTAVDISILDQSRSNGDHGVLLNERLTTDLRPTLFLAQLSNLLAGNISIVHKVTGSSRTFMGEEGAGVAAIQTAAARIRSGQSTHVLVGAAFQTEHPDMLLGYELAAYLHRGSWAPVWSRSETQGGGIVPGSGGAFLVLESRDHAEKRGRKAYARLGRVAAAGAKPDQAAISHLLGELDLPDHPHLVFSGASGAHRATEMEKIAIDQRGLAARGFSTLTGHMKEVQFPFAVALAALAVHRGAACPPFEADHEKPLDGPVETAVATAIGYHRYGGVATVAGA